MRTLEKSGFELGPKTLEIREFSPKALQMHGFYVDFDQILGYLTNLMMHSF